LRKVKYPFGSHETPRHSKGWSHMDVSFTQVQLVLLSLSLHHQHLLRLLKPTANGVLCCTTAALLLEFETIVRGMCAKRNLSVQQFIIGHIVTHVLPSALLPAPHSKREKRNGSAIAVILLLLWWLPRAGKWPEDVYVPLPQHAWWLSTAAYFFGAFKISQPKVVTGL